MPAGDGWVRCARGHRHWGRLGAAGLLLSYRADDGTRWLLMQHRAAWSHHGDTWGLLGGARAPGETAEQAAAREAGEEASLPAGAYRVTGRYVDDHGGWSYVTVLAVAASRLAVGLLGAESAEVAWVAEEGLGALALHPGFAASWPAVSALLG